MLERRAPVELLQRTPRLHKSFLREVFDALRIAFVTVQNGEHARLMPPDNFGEVIRRTAADSFQQFGVVSHGLLEFKLQLVHNEFLPAQRATCNRLKRNSNKFIPPAHRRFA